ncbi:alpha/beta fold hydrolase [Nocardioides nanhaiensis]|uniref:AB hydrolase-1 domain-containing protein n=1 Tax=Nocardioides nanhaiensis TaxID=1476871 RepID=A0ABP8WFU4_9ACTN
MSDQLPPVRPHVVETTAGPVHVRVAGHPARDDAGTPWVLLHQSPLSSRRFTSLLGHLARDGAALAPDTPGYGESPAPAGETSVEQLAETLWQGVDAVTGGRPIRLLGRATGSVIALQMAATRVADVEHLVLHGLPVYTPDEATERMAGFAPPYEPDSDGGHLTRIWQRVQGEYPWAPPDLVTSMVADYLAAGPDFATAYRAIWRFDLTDAVGAVRGAGLPVTLVGGGQDRIRHMHERARRVLPEAAEVWLPEATDFVAEQDAAGFAAVLAAAASGGGAPVTSDAPTADPAEPTQHGPLTGLRVIDVSTILAGPLACQLLGDFGADVIKVEHPTAGDSMRGHGESRDGVPLWWKEISRNKRTVGLSLSDPDGAAAFRALASTADVVVENFRPGTLEKWGLGPDVLLAENPGLVLVRVTGFGQQGPYAGRAGFGTLAEAMSGFAHLTGEESGPPTLPAFGLADSICGIAVSSAVSMALLARERNGGHGQVIDADLLMPIMTAVGPGATYYQQNGSVGQRHGNRSTNNAPRNTYRTADGSWVAVSTSAQRIAERVMRLVGRPEIVQEPWFSSGHTRAQHADELDGYVGGWIATRSRDEVLAEFTAAGAAVAAVYDARDLAEDEHVRATGMLRTVPDDELGDVLMHDVMWRMSGTPGAIRFTGRPLGADTDAVLIDEVGLDAAHVADLRRRQVVA